MGFMILVFCLHLGWSLSDGMDENGVTFVFLDVRMKTYTRTLPFWLRFQRPSHLSVLYGFNRS
jgi:hypothetical protein